MHYLNIICVNKTSFDLIATNFSVEIGNDGKHNGTTPVCTPPSMLLPAVSIIDSSGDQTYQSSQVYMDQRGNFQSGPQGTFSWVSQDNPKIGVDFDYHYPSSSGSSGEIVTLTVSPRFIGYQIEFNGTTSKLSYDQGTYTFKSSSDDKSLTVTFLEVTNSENNLPSNN
ncbi:hypothetical protein [Pseudomethylobacillus aquaticus]|uniref:hypothetical protein n=1 Tax=Pseudomethylobacillus aquaticus TaxID=2676064 RepID=UPI0011CD5591|nr:hypothetical protein [Pseudomethylobacillus aquaticus]